MNYLANYYSFEFWNYSNCKQTLRSDLSPSNLIVRITLELSIQFTRACSVCFNLYTSPSMYSGTSFSYLTFILHPYTPKTVLTYVISFLIQKTSSIFLNSPNFSNLRSRYVFKHNWWWMSFCWMFLLISPFGTFRLSFKTSSSTFISFKWGLASWVLE